VAQPRRPNARLQSESNALACQKAARIGFNQVGCAGLACAADPGRGAANVRGL